MALRTVGVRLAAEVTGYVNNLRTAAQSTRQLTGELDRAAKAGKLDAVANNAATMGVALVAGFGVAVSAAAKFDKQMSAVNAVAGASAAEMGKLRDAALQAGKQTSYSATEAGKAIEELAKAGISTSDILGGALDGALSLAAAGTLDLAEAADIAAKTMNVFQLSGQSVTHIADVLASAANKSATDVHEMGEALRMGGLVAKQAGLSLEDTVGTLAAFADRALIGSDAGTSLKTMLSMIAAPTGKSAELMKELGLNLYDAQGNFVGVEKMAGQLRDSLGGLTQQQRQAAMAQIFGADATRAATVLYEIGAEGVREYVSAVDDSGAAAETARKKTDNLAGDIERLTGSLETLAIEAGSGANTGLRTLVQTADGAVSAFSDLPGPVQSTITVLAGVAGAGLLTAAGLLKVKSTAGETLTALRDMGPAGTKAADGLGKLGSIAGKATVWAIALLAVYEASKLFVGHLNSDVEPAKRNVEEMTKALKELADTGKVQGELARAFGSDMNGLRAQMEALNVAAEKLPKGLSDSGSALGQLGRGMVDTGREAAGLNDEIAKAAMQSAENFGAVDKALAGLVQNGGVTQAKLAFDDLAARWTDAGLPLSELTRLFPEYHKAASGAATANTGLAQGFGDTAANARTMAGTLQEAIDKGQKLIDVWNQLNGATLSFDQAQLKVKDAIDAVAASFKENGKSIEGNSRAAIENRVKVGEMAQAAADAAQKKYEETGSVTDATKVYDDYIGALVKVLDAAGLTDAEIKTLIDTYASMPSSVTTAVAAPGAKTAKQQADDLKTALANIPASKQVSIWANTSSATAAVDALKSKIASLQNRNIYVSGTVYWTSKGDMKVPGGTQLKNRWGGLYEHAAEGKLREAQIASPMGPARYAWAEPETGGELFAPKFGDLAKTRREVGYAIENWWGGWKNFVPGSALIGSAAPASGAGPVTYDNRITVNPQRADFTMHDLRALQDRQDAMARVGRAR